MALINGYPIEAMYTNESYVFDCDFTDRIEFATRGAQITGTPTVTANETGGTITVSTPDPTGIVQFRFASPTQAGKVYGFTITIVTDQGDRIDGFGNVACVALP